MSTLDDGGGNMTINGIRTLTVPGAAASSEDASNRMLTVVTETMMYTEAQLKGFYTLPIEVVVKHILPYVGGVRSTESVVTSIGNRLKWFLKIAGSTFGEWIDNTKMVHHPAPVTLSNNVPQYLYNSTVYHQRWAMLKNKIDREIDPRYKLTYSTYKKDQLDFSAQTLLEFWIYIDEITMKELESVKIENLLLYVKVYSVKIN